MRALLLELCDGQTRARLADISPDDLPDGEVTVEVNWSGINYKDALAITGQGKIIRQFPMIPGIDFAGHILHSNHPRFHVGQSVILTGWGVGETHWGGLAEQARVKADWLIAMPEGLNSRKAMTIGTAGFTAMLCVMALEEGGVTPKSGEVLVTGASGGVGSTAVALLHGRGYNVCAQSGRDSTHQMLRQLGADTIISREELSGDVRPLEKQRWAGAIDTVGGNVLANLLAHIQYGGVVAACGLAGGMNLPTTVMPFILRNIRLQGIDSISVYTERRNEVWQQLTSNLPESYYQLIAREVALSEAVQAAQQLLANHSAGRTLVKIR